MEKKESAESIVSQPATSEFSFLSKMILTILLEFAAAILVLNESLHRFPTQLFRSEEYSNGSDFNRVFLDGAFWCVGSMFLFAICVILFVTAYKTALSLVEGVPWRLSVCEGQITLVTIGIRKIRKQFSFTDVKSLEVFPGLVKIDCTLRATLTSGTFVILAKGTEQEINRKKSKIEIAVRS